ncbi:MAG: hypothetical protein SF028_13200 [Candidatus Sumerlaeia bacterium]|nr:hypothetical protein [Candidatus Sumerlaeia bacterium]
MERDPDLGFGDAARKFLRAAIQGNYFYIASALLMIVGCYLLMKSPLVSGDEYLRVLKSLAVLQGYELLVIATALFIRRRFAGIGDGYVLLLIEIALLFDPTFFNNNFFSMMKNGHPPSLIYGTNAVCLALALLKVGVLEGCLGFRLTNTARLGMLAAGIMVYVAPGPLGAWATDPAQARLHLYAMAWALGAVALLMPPVGAVVALDPPGATEGQRLWLPRLLAGIPLAVVALHHLEAMAVYQIPPHRADLAPLLIAVGLLLIRQESAKEPGGGLVPVDICFALGLWLSLHRSDVVSTNQMRNLQLAHEHLGSALAAAVVLASYGLLWWRLRHRALLIRIGVLLLAVVVAALRAAGVFAWIGSLEPPSFPSAAMGFNALVLFAAGLWWWMRRDDWAALLACAAAAGGTMAALPGEHVAETMGLYFLLGAIAVDRYFPLEVRGFRFLFAVAALLLPLKAGDPWIGGACAAVALLALVLRLANRWSGEFAAALVVALVVAANWIVSDANLRVRVDPAVAALLFGGLLFAAGLYVTLHKDRVLSWLADRDAPPPDAASSAHGLARALDPPPPGWMPKPRDAPDELPAEAKPPSEAPPALAVEPPAEQAEEQFAAPPGPEAAQAHPAGAIEEPRAAEGRVRDAIRQVLVENPAEGILGGESLTGEEGRRWRQMARLGTEDRDLFWFRDERGPRLVLLEQGIVALGDGGYGARIAYDQLSLVLRRRAVLRIVTHSAQDIAVPGLSPEQARAAHATLQLLLWELGDPG